MDGSGTIPAWEQPDDIGRTLGEIRRPRWISRHSTNTRKCHKHGVYPIAYVVEDYDMPECPACASIRDTTEVLREERDEAVNKFDRLKTELGNLLGSWGIATSEDVW